MGVLDPINARLKIRIAGGRNPIVMTNHIYIYVLIETGKVQYWNSLSFFACVRFAHNTCFVVPCCMGVTPVATDLRVSDE